jgi:hypothetical protein
MLQILASTLMEAARQTAPEYDRKAESRENPLRRVRTGGLILAPKSPR